MIRNFLLAATMLAGVATAAPGYAQPVTGLYIGGGGGGNFLQRETTKSIGGVPAGGTYAGFESGYVGLASVGYGLGNGLRVELEGNFRHNSFGQNSPLGTGRSSNGSEEKYGGMVNALFDLDVGSPYVYPYIGGGLGYAQVDQKQSIGAGAFEQRLRGSQGSFAYQAIAGLSFPIPPVVGLSLTAEYRYYALAGDRAYEVSGPAGAGSTRINTTDNYNHSLLLGLRYAFNVPPPPVAATPAAPIQAVQSARTYLVFFDWDRADLTDRARQIIAAAAQGAQQTQTTRIEVIVV